MLCKRNKSKRSYIVWFYIYEMPTIGISIKTESGLVVGIGGGGTEEGWEEDS